MENYLRNFPEGSKNSNLFQGLESLSFEKRKQLKKKTQQKQKIPTKKLPFQTQTDYVSHSKSPLWHIENRLNCVCARSKWTEHTHTMRCAIQSLNTSWTCDVGTHTLTLATTQWHSPQSKLTQRSKPHSHRRHTKKWWPIVCHNLWGERQMKKKFFFLYRTKTI